MKKIIFTTLFYLFALEGVITSFLSLSSYFLGSFDNYSLYIITIISVTLIFFGLYIIFWNVQKMMIERLEELENEIYWRVVDKKKERSGEV